MTASSPPIDVDGVIVGGGPAGALVATLLAGQGWGALLADARRPGAVKACGHCLNPRGVDALRTAGLGDVVPATAGGSFQRLRIHRPGRRPIETEMRGDRTGRLTPRGAFDGALVERAKEAGADVRRPARARLESIDGGIARVQIRSAAGIERVRTPLVIGADGLNSALARAAGMARRGKPGRKFGFSFTVPPPYGPRAGAGAVDMFVLSDGYLGVVEHDDGRIHAAGLIDRRSAADARPSAFLRRMAAHFPALTEVVDACGEEMSFEAAGPMPCRPRVVAAGPVALVGDAAGYQEPFTGEGMTWALESAALLGRVAAAVSPGRWTSDCARQYAMHWRREIGARQRLCAVVSKALERPAMVDALGAAAGLRRALPALAARSVMGRRSTA